jgi:glycosyltransferase involved in cell wall biosynthesis
MSTCWSFSQRVAAGQQAQRSPEPQMAEKPTFSVVIAAHNAERTLPSTVRSVLAQTRPDFEILVVDDGSTDETGGALGGFSDERIVYVRQANLGPAAARNSGIERATGEYVCMLDSDDLWLPDYLRVMGAALDADEGAALAFTDAWRLDDVSRRVGRRTTMRQYRPPRRPPTQRDALLFELLKRNFVFTSATVRRRVLEDVGGFGPFCGPEDYELWLRIAASGARFVNVGKVLAVYRDRPGSLSSNRAGMLRGYADVLEHVLATYDLTEEMRSLAERQLRETRRELSTPADVDSEQSEEDRGVLRRLGHQLRWYRLRPPRAVVSAFPDLKAI